MSQGGTRPRRRPVVAGAVAVVAVSAGIAWMLLGRASAVADDEPQDTGRTLSTVLVERQDLLVVQDAPAVVDHGPAHEITLRRSGTITWLPEVGTVLAAGDAAARVDERRVPVLVGGTPMYRVLDGSGMKGQDVQTVADNLTGLGYLDGFPAGDATGPNFAGAVRRWREANDLGPLELSDASWTGTGSQEGMQGVRQGDESASGDEEGDAPESDDGSSGDPASPGAPAVLRWDAISPDEVVFLAEPVRVSAVPGALGGASDAGPVLEVTAVRKRVVVAPEETRRVALTQGAEVLVVLPDGTETAGVVSSVAGSDGDDQGAAAVVDVEDQDVLSGLDSGPVSVRVVTDRSDDVLVVPVASLLALAEGGHALQREDGSLVAVETGLFAGDLVEVSGPEVSEGMRVVTAR